MTGPPISVAYYLYHQKAEPVAVMPLVEQVRQKAIELGFLRVGDLVFLEGDAEILSHEYGDRFLAADLEFVPAIPRAVCYFIAALPDSDLTEIGLAYNPCEVQIDGQPVRFGQPYWMWNGGVETRDIKTFLLLMRYCAAVGIEVVMSFGGKTLMYGRDKAGRVRITEEWDDIDDDG